MTKTVTIYFRKAKDVTLADDFSLSAPTYYDETREDWDEGTEYTMPEGYSVGENVYGETGIFDPSNRMCDIVRHSSGRPQLVSTHHQMPVLIKATT